MFHLIAVTVVTAWYVLRVLIPAAIAVRLALAAVRFARLPRGSRRHFWLARWHRLRWRWLCANLGLSYLDKHRKGISRPGSTKTVANGAPAGHVRFPRARFTADEFGFTAKVKTVPGVGREQLEDAALDHIANAWKCCRVQVSQQKPGRLIVRGLRRDPLAAPLPASVLPAFDGRHITLGRDQDGTMRRPSLANHSGTCWAGNPGRGKTEAALSLAVQLAPSPLVDLHVLDGGECDWQHFADGAEGYVGADLAAAADMLADLDAKMIGRRRNLEADLGVRNAWAIGPTEAYRLQWILVEECPFFLSLDQVKGNKKREAQVAACRGFLTSMLRRGRAPMFHVSLITQRATTTSLPSDIRDLCGLRWSFGCTTTDAAVAALGDDIRSYETLSPVQLQGPEHVGIACARLVTGRLPYTLIKFPAIGQQLADETAGRIATRRKPQIESAAPADPPIPALAPVPDIPLPAAAVAS